MPRKARIFIGSSTEALDAAHAVRSLLASADIEIDLWSENFSRPGSSFLETLMESLDSFDFAVMLATPDDLVTARGKSLLSPRDNILFELGLFMGRLGRGRTLLIHPRNAQLKLPSDLLGVATVSCDWPSAESIHPEGFSLGQYKSALGPACDQIRDTVREWRVGIENNVRYEPGLIDCYINFNEAQAAIGRKIADSKSQIFLMATNFYHTPILNRAEFEHKINRGVSIRFLVLNPMTVILPHVTRSIAMIEEDLRAENRLGLKTILQLQAYADSCRRESTSAGEVAIKLFDSPPRGRNYVFDGPEGESFFVPYACHGPTRPLPVFHCVNSGQIARRNICGMEELWKSDDTITIRSFMEEYPEFLKSK